MAYTKKTWTKGEIIKATDLNNMETGIEAVTDEVEANNACFDRERQVVEFLQDGLGTSTAISSLVLGGYSNHYGRTYVPSIQGQLKVVIGNAITSNKSLQLIISQLYRVTPGAQNIFPWTVDYLDDNNVMRGTVNGVAAITVGSSVGTNQNDFVMGAMNLVTGGIASCFGQYGYVSAHLASVFGEAMLAGYRAQFCVGCANENKEEDAFEIGNGTYDTSAGTISRSNAFRVTKTGSAIAQTSLGIEDGNGGVVTITAEQLQALLALIPPQYEVKELTSSNRTYSMAAFDDISKLPTPTPYELQAQGYYLNTESTTIAGLRMEGGVSPAINGAILKVDGGSTVNFNPGALDISYAMCEFNANMNQPIGGASPSTWLTESTTLKDTTAYIGIHFKVNSGEMTEAIRNQLLSTIEIVAK